MSLPINIAQLINGKMVESERIEYKKNWDPLDVIQSVCAFANDINKIQQKLLNLCKELRPNYFPIAEQEEFQGRQIFIIWIPGGETRPYKAPDSLPKPRNYSYYIRRFSSTVKATDQEVRDLITMSAHIPYDDQINQQANITDLNVNLIQSHLVEIGSDLSNRIDQVHLIDLCRRMNIVSGPDEYIKPKNIGLLLFNPNPTSFFPCAQIDLVQFHNDIGDQYTEKIFQGPIQQQLRDALFYIKNSIITEAIRKVSGKAESIRFYNYPFEAIEEALSNTVYHRSYQDDSPIELRVYPNRIEMISYPGPLPPLNKEKLQSGRVVARKYRNRRIGDFLKELHLTEGRGTGIPKIIRVMKINGSPEPIFDTDDDLTYFLTCLPIHPDFKRVQDRVQDQVQDRVQDEKGILTYCLRPKKRSEIFIRIGVYNNYDQFKKYIRPLLEKGYLARTIPDKLSSRNQQYKTTPSGKNT